MPTIAKMENSTHIPSTKNQPTRPAPDDLSTTIIITVHAIKRERTGAFGFMNKFHLDDESAFVAAICIPFQYAYYLYSVSKFVFSGSVFNNI